MQGAYNHYVTFLLFHSGLIPRLSSGELNLIILRLLLFLLHALTSYALVPYVLTHHALLVFKNPRALPSYFLLARLELKFELSHASPRYAVLVFEVDQLILHNAQRGDKTRYSGRRD